MLQEQEVLGWKFLEQKLYSTPNLVLVISIDGFDPLVVQTCVQQTIGKTSKEILLCCDID